MARLVKSKETETVEQILARFDFERVQNILVRCDMYLGDGERSIDYLKHVAENVIYWLLEAQNDSNPAVSVESDGFKASIHKDCVTLEFVIAKAESNIE